AVFPSADTATEIPWRAGPAAALPTSLEPSWLHTPPLRVHTHAAPTPPLSLNPPTTAVFPSADTATEIPCLATPTAPAPTRRPPSRRPPPPPSPPAASTLPRSPSPPPRRPPSRCRRPPRRRRSPPPPTPRRRSLAPQRPRRPRPPASPAGSTLHRCASTPTPR